jgi:hypothetical protein
MFSLKHNSNILNSLIIIFEFTHLYCDYYGYVRSTSKHPLTNLSRSESEIEDNFYNTYAS